MIYATHSESKVSTRKHEIQRMMRTYIKMYTFVKMRLFQNLCLVLSDICFFDLLHIWNFAVITLIRAIIHLCCCIYIHR